MNGARAAGQRSPPSSEDITEASDLLSNPSYDIITEDVGRFTTQYYHTVEPSEGILSPKDGGGGSSSDSSSSGRSKTSSTSSDEGGHHHRKSDQTSPPSEDVRSSASLPTTLEYVVPALQQKVAVSVCGSVSGQGAGGGEGTSVKHWSYEEQFKQVLTYSLCLSPFNVSTAKIFLLSKNLLSPSLSEAKCISTLSLSFSIPFLSLSL